MVTRALAGMLKVNRSGMRSLYRSPWLSFAAIYNMMVDQPDKAMDWLEKGFEVRDQRMPYIATHGFLFEPLFDNPRFIAILEKMNLPLPEK
jgi:hypothetical protein